MDGDNQKEKKIVYNPDKVNKTENSHNKKIVAQFPETSGQRKEFNSNQSKNRAKFVGKGIQDKDEKQRGSNSEKNHHNNVDPTVSSKNIEKDLGDVKNFPLRTPKKKKIPMKPFKRDTIKQSTLQIENEIVAQLSEETFEIEDILNNSTTSELIQDLVNCFTANSTLPKNELQTLQESLFERTCYVFLNILNSCVKKTFARVMNSDFIQEFQNKLVSKQDACCQTHFSDVSEAAEGPEVQQNVIP